MSKRKQYSTDAQLCILASEWFFLDMVVELEIEMRKLEPYPFTRLAHLTDFSPEQNEQLSSFYYLILAEYVNSPNEDNSNDFLF